MFKPFATALIVTVSATLGTAAEAVEYSFTAFINSTSDGTFDPLPQLGLAPGDTITGSFSYTLDAQASFSTERPDNSGICEYSCF